MALMAVALLSTRVKIRPESVHHMDDAANYRAFGTDAGGAQVFPGTRGVVDGKRRYGMRIRYSHSPSLPMLSLRDVTCQIRAE